MEDTEKEKSKQMLNQFKKAMLEINSVEIVKSRVKAMTYFKFCLFGQFGHIGSFVSH